ncbi:MAG: radical SAM protein [Acidobacteria bacterium]|nr:radical SAM protein [Acidobacteriota bacterium]
MKVALINTNRMQPPIAPIGLDYIASALQAAGHEVRLSDLCWEEDAETAIAGFFNGSEFGLVGMTLRNTDDCVYTSRQSFLAGFLDLVKAVRKNSAAPIVLGGVGFSTMAEQVLSPADVDYGVWGDGEFAMTALADGLERADKNLDIPNLILRANGAWKRNPPVMRSLQDLPPMLREFVDNRRYFQQGGQSGFETKRGCPGGCIYCADPVAKGKQVRVRPPSAVADEIEALVEQGIDCLHTCDGEFNIPEDHAMAVCREIIRRGLGEKIRWYAYCSPMPFSRELAAAMRRAGCAGIDFGADNGSETMLRRLGRSFGPGDILNVTRWSREEGMAVMLDLLLGAPGESRESITRTVELMKKADPDRVGVSLGVRVYPGTPLEEEVTGREDTGGLVGGRDPFDPLFFLEPGIEQGVFEWLHASIGDDRRFLFYDPSRPKQNYNYNDNQRLVDAIKKGHRGAYWDILRKL